MRVLRFCRSCSGPRPLAARRCPWCLRDFDSAQSAPEHLFAPFDRKDNLRPIWMQGHEESSK
jgi:predicted amidophosphoribosyltransferase